MTDAPPVHRTKKGRSPSYPGIDLKTAVERAQRLYDREKRNPAPMSVITHHWGFKSPTTGPAAVTYAALKKFGLIEETGKGSQRMAKLTPLALDILLNPDPEAKQAALQAAALKPGIHSELWHARTDDGLPSDSALRYDLLVNRGFTENGATEFIREFRDTLAVAQLDDTANLYVDPQPEGLAESLLASTGAPIVPTTEAPPLDPDAKLKPKTEPLSFKMTLPGGGEAVIATTRPMTEAEWGRLQIMLEQMKPTFVPEGE
jgi:hypothetical protein